MHITFVAATLLASTVSAQSTFIVDPQGLGDFTSIQQAVDAPAVTDGDTILVLPGIYNEAVVVHGRQLQIIADGAPGEVLLNGQATFTPFTFTDAAPGSSLVGFTIVGGYPAGGIKVTSSNLLIEDCVIQDNFGLFNDAGGLSIGGQSQVLLANCLIQRNQSSIWGASLVIGDSNVVIQRSTIRNNSTTVTGEIMHWNNGSVTIEDSILDGSNWPPVQHNTGAPVATVRRTLCPGASSTYWWNPTCIDASPEFADDGSGFAPLSSMGAGQAVDSPAIDAGDPGYLPTGTTRTDGVQDCWPLDLGYHAPSCGGHETYCVASGNSSGQVASISTCSSTSLSANAFHLQVQGAPPNKFGLFFFGTQEHFALYGEGALCVKPPLKRIYPLLVTDGAGAASAPLDLTSSVFGGLQAGQVRRFQFWYRDPLGGPAGFNFSDGLKVTFCP